MRPQAERELTHDLHPVFLPHVRFRVRETFGEIEEQGTSELGFACGDQIG
ncbi:hypothetical protein [Streptomyces sp. NPDC001657]